MPRPPKRRGKYEEQRKLREAKRAARAREGALNNEDRPHKRQKKSNSGLTLPVIDTSSQNGGSTIEDGNGDADFIPFENQLPPQDETQFYGLLDPEEQEYYAHVNNKITANDFESDEDRQTFVEAVYRESKGKELKLASSQSCSRYLEKLIHLSTPEQLRALFATFLGSFTYLVQHRFGSHCCETLFLEAAKHVTGEKNREDPNSFENSFINATRELRLNSGYLLTERFASHTLRVLILVLSGEPLEDATNKMIVASRKKEKLDLPAVGDESSATKQRPVPRCFTKALNKLIAFAISKLDTTYLRALATHPTGNPVLQLLLRLELTSSERAGQYDKKSLFWKLFPDAASMKKDTESAKFISGLLYDPSGSHLIEVLVRHASGKTFKKMYKNILKERLPNMAKNDVAGYVAIRVLERLGKDDLEEAINQIIPEIPIMVERGRTGLIRVLIDRCVVRGVDMEPLAEAIAKAYGSAGKSLVKRMVGIKSTAEPQKRNLPEVENEVNIDPAESDVHGSLLAQTMLQAPVVSTLIQDSLLEQKATSLIKMANHPIASRVIQVSLTSPTVPISFRKQFVPVFYDHVAELAVNASGSHVVDALWDSTKGLHFIKERLAKELANNESKLRESYYGRNVWRNWSMDTYQRRPGEWQATAKGFDEQPQENGGEPEKTGIQQARERHAKKKSKRVD